MWINDYYNVLSFQKLAWPKLIEDKTFCPLKYFGQAFSTFYLVRAKSGAYKLCWF